MEIIVPVIDRIQQADGGDHRFGHGAHDGHQRAQIPGAVDPGGFLYTPSTLADSITSFGSPSI